jgi:hypothetical protein
MIGFVSSQERNAEEVMTQPVDMKVRHLMLPFASFHPCLPIPRM